MSLIGFKAQNHRQQTGARGALDKVDDRRTPESLWRPLDIEFCFTLDAAASFLNAKCRRYFTVAENGLAQPWTDERVWCNPPYSACGAWVTKANDEMRNGCELVVMLLPANRTEQGWWQKQVEPHRRAGRIETRFLAGRLRFDVPDGTYSDPRGNRPPFGCVLLIWERDRVGTTEITGRALGGSRAAGRPQDVDPRQQ